MPSRRAFGYPVAFRFRREEVTIRDDRWVVARLDPKTGAERSHREILRDRLEDQMFASYVRVSRSGAVIAGTTNRIVSDLFLIEGVR